MLQTLTPQELTLKIGVQDLGFADTSQLLGKSKKSSSANKSWIGQASAEKAAKFGLSLQQPGFNLLVLGEPGCGRTSLLLSAMQEIAAQRPAAPDLVFLYNFDVPEKPLALHLKAGEGAVLRTALDNYVRQLAKVLPALIGETATQTQTEGKVESPTEKIISKQARAAVTQFLNEQIAILNKLVSLHVPAFTRYLEALKHDTLENLEIFQLHSSAESDGTMEGFLSRYRANLLVDNRDAKGAPVIYEDDPTFQSLFGGMEGSPDHASNTADFMRLRAGNLLRANGGMLMLHLRDIESDQHNGPQILEKLHRFLRNGRVQIEEAGGTSSHGSTSHLTPEALPVHVKVILIATREEYYALQDEASELAGFFRIKVDFVDSFAANSATYKAVAAYVAERCAHFQLKHFTAKAVARLLRAMQRWVDDQTRISANFAELQGLILESAAVANSREAELVEFQDVEDAIAAQQARHEYTEQQMREAIVEGDLLIRVQGREIGQINGLTHMDLGDASFGSPVRISARCYAGDEGIVNISREVEMSGPNHDKGIFILQSWLSASFARLTPLCLTASLVFEQEYHGVEGDSASCAELYALLSALSGLPLPQGIAVTGALNQHGEVMPIGGINEKIEGYFRVCKQVGLDGTQGVVIPSRNKQHLMLDGEIITAVEQGQFHIYVINHVLEGIEHLTGMSAGNADAEGNYRAETVMGRIQRTLEVFHHACESNQPSTSPRTRRNKQFE
jgi:predicted ATP-dependent protease